MMVTAGATCVNQHRRLPHGKGDATVWVSDTKWKFSAGRTGVDDDPADTVNSQQSHARDGSRIKGQHSTCFTPCSGLSLGQVIK